jgi:hypothetical protein
MTIVCNANWSSVIGEFITNEIGQNVIGEIGNVYNLNKLMNALQW